MSLQHPYSSDLVSDIIPTRPPLKIIHHYAMTYRNATIQCPVKTSLAVSPFLSLCLSSTNMPWKPKWIDLQHSITHQHSWEPEPDCCLLSSLSDNAHYDLLRGICAGSIAGLEFQLKRRVLTLAGKPGCASPDAPLIVKKSTWVVRGHKVAQVDWIISCVDSSSWYSPQCFKACKGHKQVGSGCRTPNK